MNSLLLGVPKGEGHVTPQGTTGSVERQRERGDCGHEPHFGFCGKKWARQSEQAEDRLVWIIFVGSGTQALSAGPGVIRAGG